MKRFIGISCIVLGVLLALVTLGQSQFSFDFGFGEEAEAEGDVLDRSLAEIEQLNIDVSSTHVYVSSADADQLHLELKKSGNSQATIQANERGRQLHVSIRRPFFRPLGWLQDLISGNLPQREELHVTVPQNYAQDLRLDSSSGKMDVTGVEGLRELAVDISSGQVLLEDISTDRFSYDGSSGRLTVQGMDVRESEIDISSGKVTLNKVSGEIQGSSSSGSVLMDMESLAGPIAWEASSGSITLRLPHQASFDLNASTSSGSIDSDFPVLVQSQSKRELGGIVGDGGVPVDLSVSSGNIKIEQKSR